MASTVSDTFCADSREPDTPESSVSLRNVSLCDVRSLFSEYPRPNRHAPPGDVMRVAEIDDPLKLESVKLFVTAKSSDQRPGRCASAAAETAPAESAHATGRAAHAGRAGARASADASASAKKA